MSANKVPWKGLHGVKRVTREFKYIQQQIANGTLKQISNLELVNENLCKWRFRVKDFDEDHPAGRQLNEDLRKLSSKYGIDYLLMEASFPTDYPTQPFLIRVVRPR